MADTSYTIRARIVADPPKLDQVKRKFDDLGKHSQKTGSILKGSFLEGFSPILKGGIVLLALKTVHSLMQRLVSTFSGVLDSVSNLGGTLEATKLGLAQALSEGFDLGFAEAGQHADAMFDRLRKRARDMSVGSLNDVIDVARDVTAPGAQAGMGSRAIEDLAFNSTALGRMWGFEAGAIGDSIRRALDSGEVAAGRDSVVSRALGGKEGVQKFNKIQDPGERAKVLAEAFASASTVLGVASQTWASSWGTLWDIIDEAKEAFTSIAFEGLKQTVADLNNALDGGGLTEAAYQMGTVVNALMEPFRWLAQIVIEVTNVFQAMPAWGDYLALTFGEIGEDLTEFGRWIGEVAVTMSVGLLPVITLLGTALVGLTKSIRIIVQGLVSLVDLLWQTIKWVASWVTDKVQADFSGAMNRYVDGINDIFRVERRQREKAADREKDKELKRQASAKKNNQLNVKVALDQRIEWGDSKALAVGIENLLREVAERAARFGADSAYAFPRYV